jgi:hypothetical protein
LTTPLFGHVRQDADPKGSAEMVFLMMTFWLWLWLRLGGHRS